MTEKEEYVCAEKQQKLDEKLNIPMQDDTQKEELFNKHFLISDKEKIEYVLPKPESMFKMQSWKLDNLQALKNNLNEVKNCLNNFNLVEWQRHTYQTNRAGIITTYVKKHIQPEFITQAWCKFYEIVCNFPLVPLNEISHDENNGSFTSVHLCEAPGAFVIALNHWLKLNARHVQWDWIANTLNPYCEGNPYNQMVDDDRFIKYTLKHWYFGADNTGNLMNLQNLDALTKKLRANTKGPIMLVTADGSIDCMNMPGEQENAVAHLHFCETVACMHLLQKGGSFLLKIFTLFEQQSICLMYLLSCVFHQVTITKPATSKPGNSETYVVCLNFKGKNCVAPYLDILRQHYDAYPMQSMFNRQDIPNSFIQKIEDCNKFFMHYQCKIIKDNINTFYAKKKDKDFFSELQQIRQMIAIAYLKIYKLRKIDCTDEIIGRKIIESHDYIISRKIHSESYNDRCKRHELGFRERLQQIWNAAKEIDLPTEISFTWALQTLPKNLEIQIGKTFNKIHSSRFCEAKILLILNEVNNILPDTRICFPSTNMKEKYEHFINLGYEILSFQFTDTYDSHLIITKIKDQLEKLKIGQRLILVGYSLLTQLSVGLLYILRCTFDGIIINIHADGYDIILTNYRHDQEILNHLHTIFITSCNAHKENMTVWSVIPMTVLYEWNQYHMIIQLNHLVIKQYVNHVCDTIKKT